MGKGKIKIQVLDFKDARSVLPNKMGFLSSLFLALHLFKLPTRASESPERTQELLCTRHSSIYFTLRFTAFLALYGFLIGRKMLGYSKCSPLKGSRCFKCFSSEIFSNFFIIF